MLLMADVLQAADLSRNDFNYLLQADVLTTPLQKVKQGIRRSFTRENTIEIAFLRALMRHGISLAWARHKASQWVKDEAAGHLCQVVAVNEEANKVVSLSRSDTIEAAIFLASRNASGWSGDERPDPKQLLADRRPASHLVIIDLEAIVAAVDAALDRTDGE